MPDIGAVSYPSCSMTAYVYFLVHMSNVLEMHVVLDGQRKALSR